MSDAQDLLKEAEETAVDGSLFSTFDIIILTALLAATLWWFYSSRKDNKKDEILLTKYSIQ